MKRQLRVGRTVLFQCSYLKLSVNADLFKLTVETAEAMRIIKALANGADAVTGELLPESSPYNNPQVIRTLFQALKALERLNEREKRQRTLPPNAGRS